MVLARQLLRPEPEFQYLYAPYKDQDNIGVYDSTTMRQDYYSLFSDRRCCRFRL